MLFIQSNSLTLPTNEAERLRLLDALEAKGFAPLLRSIRRRLLQTLLSGVGKREPAADLSAPFERETAAARVGADAGEAYTPGELF